MWNIRSPHPLSQAHMDLHFTQPSVFAQRLSSLLWELWEREYSLPSSSPDYPKTLNSTALF
jgi:hypothetical protein